MKRNQEDQAERRLRKVNDIKTMFWKRLAEENKKPKEESEIRHIIAGRR